MTTVVTRLQTGADLHIVELAPDVIMTYQRVGEPERDYTVRLLRLSPESSSVFPQVRYKGSFVTLLAHDYIGASWTNGMLFRVCYEWYTQHLFMRRGGLRATWCVWHLLKAMRDASRTLQRQLDERESGASRA